MTIEERGAAILEKMAVVREHRRETDRLLAELAEQACLMRQGIDPQDVKALLPGPASFCPKSKTPDRVILKDGREVKLPAGWRKW
jgi:hypothetical protein